MPFYLDSGLNFVDLVDLVRENLLDYHKVKNSDPRPRPRSQVQPGNENIEAPPPVAMCNITHYPLPITHYPLPITHSQLPIPHSPFPITHSPFPIPQC